MSTSSTFRLTNPLPTNTIIRIALHGYARTGKDTVGRILMDEVAGMQRVAFGDIIKGDLDELVRNHLGFSAFTENDVEKKRIREVLVHWGYANYESIEHRFFSALPLLAVNTRLFRPREAELWIKSGGVVWEVTRPGTEPVEPREAAELLACREAGYISRVVANDGSIDDLRVRTLDALHGVLAP